MKKFFIVATIGILLFAATGVSQIRRDDGLSDAERREPQAVQSQLLKARETIRSKRLNYRVGVTGVARRNIQSLTGNIIPPNIRQIAVEQNLSAAKTLKVSPNQLLDVDLSKIKLSNFGAKANPTLQLEIDKFGKVKQKSADGTMTVGKSESEKNAEGKPHPYGVNAQSSLFDWRGHGISLPVRNQQCGNCWAYATQAVYELVTKWRFNTADFNTSEQFLVSNGKAGNCTGGYTYLANKFLMSFGAMKEDTYPDTGTDGVPASNISSLQPFHPPILTFGFVDPKNSEPSVADIKKAVVNYGPISVAINATDAFKLYTEGVFDEGANEKVNHSVVIMGWDDSKGAWIIRNSWGNDWGTTAGYGSERGYGYVKYGSNLVGSWAQWIVVK